MTYQPKVENTRKHHDGQQTHEVAPAKLKLVKTSDPKDLAIKDNPGFYLPILISESEPIKDGDKVLQLEGGYIFDSHEDEDRIHKTSKKILAMPRENFSSVLMQMIEDGILKDGDTFTIKCEYETTPEGTPFADWYQIHLDDEDNVTIFYHRPSMEDLRDQYVHGDHAANIAGDPLHEQLEAAFEAGWKAKENQL